MADNVVASLEQFPPIPVEGKITIGESHSELHSLPSSLDNPSTGAGFLAEISQYAVLDGNELTNRLPFKIPSVRVADSRASFIRQKKETVPKAIWDAWWEEGLVGVYDCLLNLDNTTPLSTNSKRLLQMFASVTGFCVQVSGVPSKLVAYLFPHLKLKVEEINEEYSRVRRWKESWVRAVAWHPTSSRFALAMNDDSVRCVVVGKTVVPMLRCQQQRNVTSVSWRPYITTELAVGCEDGVIVWYLTPSYGKDKTRFIQVNGHAPVNSVEYSTDGYLLLTSSAKDNSIYVWDAQIWNRAPLKRIGGGGIPLAMFSPKGSRLLAASPNTAFWIWEDKNGNVWDCTRWDTPKTMVEAACWHPNGKTLLFASAGFLYGLFFELSAVDKFVTQADALVKVVFNIEETHRLDEEDNLAYKVGGRVRELQWDPTGHRVAVMFDDSDMIAVFRVLPNSRTEFLSPLGYIRGHADESPRAISFQKDFKHGALLTIAWDSGRIQYFPMIFALPSSLKNIIHEDNYSSAQHQHNQSAFNAAGFVSPRLSASFVEPSSPASSSFYGAPSTSTSPSRLYSMPQQ